METSAAENVRATLDGQRLQLGKCLARHLSLLHAFRPGREGRSHCSVESDLPEGPFEQVRFDKDVSILPIGPRVYDLPVEYGGRGAYGMRFSLAYDDPFATLITPDTPAWLGSVVHVLATGLGPIDPANGQLLVEPDCSWAQPTALVPIRPLYVGALDGSPGVYRLSFRLPDSLPPKMTYEGALQIGCRLQPSFLSPLVMLVAIRR